MSYLLEPLLGIIKDYGISPKTLATDKELKIVFTEDDISRIFKGNLDPRVRDAVTVTIEGKNIVITIRLLP